MKRIIGFFKGRNKKMKTLEKTVNTKIDTKPEWAELCDECFSATKKNKWTKDDSRKLLKSVRKELKQIETC